MSERSFAELHARAVARLRGMTLVKEPLPAEALNVLNAAATGLAVMAGPVVEGKSLPQELVEINRSFLALLGIEVDGDLYLFAAEICSAPH